MWARFGAWSSSVLHLWQGRWYKRPSCSWSISCNETENRFHLKFSVTYNQVNDVVNSPPVAMLASATGRSESVWPCGTSFRAGRWTIKREPQCTQSLPNCSHPPSTQWPATVPFLPLLPHVPTGRAHSAREASGFSNPPPQLGVDALDAVKSGVRPARSAGVYLQLPWRWGVFKGSWVWDSGRQRHGPLPWCESGEDQTSDWLHSSLASAACSRYCKAVTYVSGQVFQGKQGGSYDMKRYRDAVGIDRSVSFLLLLLLFCMIS